MVFALRALALALVLPGTALGQTAGPAGTWFNEDKDGIVQIGDCGQLRGQVRTGTLCGHVVWIRDAIDRATGRPPVDAKNIDPALRGRPIMGLPVVLDMRPAGTNGRWDGHVYNIDDGKTYAGTLTLLGNGQLRVDGCVMLACRGETWTRQAMPENHGRPANAPAVRLPAR